MICTTLTCNVRHCNSNYNRWVVEMLSVSVIQNLNWHLWASGMCIFLLQKPKNLLHFCLANFNGKEQRSRNWISEKSTPTWRHTFSFCSSLATLVTVYASYAATIVYHSKVQCIKSWHDYRHHPYNKPLWFTTLHRFRVRCIVLHTRTHADAHAHTRLNDKTNKIKRFRTSARSTFPLCAVQVFCVVSNEYDSGTKHGLDMWNCKRNGIR